MDPTKREFNHTRWLTVDMSESKTLTAKAVPHANGWVRYSSVSGSSSSSWSRNCTLLSLTSSVIMGTLAPYTDPRLCNTMGPPAQFRPSGSNCLVTIVSSVRENRILFFYKNKKKYIFARVFTCVNTARFKRAVFTLLMVDHKNSN